MSKTQRTAILFLTVLAVLCSCKGGGTSGYGDGGDTLKLKYASNISIVKHQGYIMVSLRNPWKEGKTLHRYILVPRSSEVPADLPEGTVLRTPLLKATVFTTVHCGLLMHLGKQECINGVADLKYIKIPWIHEKVKEGKIADCGEGMSPVIEKIIDIKPDAVFLSPFENSGGYGKLEEIDIPLIECAEYMETSPLGRAEWMKFYGLLFGAENEADSLFHVVDSSYHNLKQIATTSGTKCSVLMDKVIGSAWYVPGGRSTIGQMVADARGIYPFAADARSGSIPLPFESVLEKAGNSDVWLLRYSSDRTMTLDELKSGHRGYEHIKAFRQQNVYGCNVEQTRFYEETPFRPDYLLSDFIQIFHPDIIGLEPLRYYLKLK